MPRTNRIKCAGCDKGIDGGYPNACSNNLFRLFLSARSLKKITATDSACRKCRHKFDNSIKKTKDDFQHPIGFINIEKVTLVFFDKF